MNEQYRQRKNRGKFAYLEFLESRQLLSAVNTAGVTWSTYFGGSGNEEITAITHDANDNILASGWSGSANLPLATGADTASDNDNGFVAKFDSHGTLLWSTYIGGSDDYSVAQSIAVDASGNAYITGVTGASDLVGALNDASGGRDGFVAKISSDGAVLWSRYLGGSDDDEGRSIALDASGNAYITGITASIDFTGASNSNAGGEDAFVAKINGNGALQWAKYFSGSADDQTGGIAVNNAGEAMIAGTTTSTDLPSANNAYHGGSSDAFAAEFDASGALQWSTYLGGSGAEQFLGSSTSIQSALAWDTDGTAVITGYTDSANFSLAKNKISSGGDGFVAKIDGTGTLLWSAFLGGSAKDVGLAVTLDSQHNIFVAGAASFTSIAGSTMNGLLAELSPGGVIDSIKQFGGGKNDYAETLSFDSAGNLWLAGGTFSTDLPLADNAAPGGVTDSDPGEFHDGYLAEIPAAPATVWTTESSLNAARDQFAAGVVDGKIYVFGGNAFGTGHNLTSTEVFDPGTNTWSSAADNPDNNGDGVEEVSGAALNGKFYVFGGYGGVGPSGQNGDFNFNEVYDPATDSWSPIAPKPTVAHDGAYAVYNGEIYVFGGDYHDPLSGQVTPYNVVEAYNPTTNSWRTVTQMPQTLAGETVAVVGDSAYVIGGAAVNALGNFTSLNKNIFRFNFLTNTWTTTGFASLPMPRFSSHDAAAPVIDGKIYIVGGLTGSIANGVPTNVSTLNSVEIYDPVANKWTAGPSFPAPCNEEGVVAVGSTLYVIGGNDGSGGDPSGGGGIRGDVWAWDTDAAPSSLVGDTMLKFGGSDPDAVVQVVKFTSSSSLTATLVNPVRTKTFTYTYALTGSTTASVIDSDAQGEHFQNALSFTTANSGTLNDGTGDNSIFVLYPTPAQKLSPTSLAGGIFTLNITTGAGTYPSSGNLTWASSASGANYAISGTGGVNSTGTSTFTPDMSGVPEAAVIGYNDSQLGAGQMYLAFTSASAGTFYLVNPVDAVNNFASGTFDLAFSATHLAFAQQPSSAIAGQTITHAGAVAPALVVNIFDAHGNIVSNDTSPVTITLVAANGATLGGTTTVNAINGVATFNDLAVDSAGTYTFSISDSADNLSNIVSGKFTVTPDLSTSQLFLFQQPLTTTVGNDLLLPLVVKIEDQFHNVITTDHSKVTVSIVNGPTTGTLGGTTTVAASKGIATLSKVTLSTAGTYTLAASDASVHNNSQLQFTQVIKLATTTAAAPHPAAAYAFGSTVTLTDTFKSDAPSSIPFTGIVAVYDSNSQLVGTFPIAANGTAKLTLPTVNGSQVNITGGSHVYTAVYSGDLNHTAFTTGSFTLVIKPAATKTTLATSAAQLTSGQSLTLTASVTSTAASGVPHSGTVTFLDNGSAFGTMTLSGSVASTTFAPAPGVHKYTAVYSDDANFSGGNSGNAKIVTDNAAANIVAGDAPFSARIDRQTDYGLNLVTLAKSGGVVTRNNLRLRFRLP